MGEEAATEPEDTPRHMQGKIWEWINRTDLIYVISGGALGGFLMPLVRRFLRSETPFNEAIKTPEYYDAWFLAALLGAICAGVVVYSLSYSENNNRRQVFFIALLAGLTFPGFLSGALDIEQTKEQISETVLDAKLAGATADGAGTKKEKEVLAEKGSELLVTALEKVDAEALDEADKIKVEKDAQEAIDSIAASAVEEDGKINPVIALQVEQVVNKAKSQGYDVAPRDGVAQKVVKGLNAQIEDENRAARRRLDRTGARRIVGPQ